MNTTCLPQLRMSLRKSCSLAEYGRSSEVTKKTMSARGTKPSVRSCSSRCIEFVPGVSTMFSSCSTSTGSSCTSRRGSASRTDSMAPWRSRCTDRVVGSSPVSRASVPRTALRNVDLPALNSPTTMIRNSSSRRRRIASRASTSPGTRSRSASRARLASNSARCSCTSSRSSGVSSGSMRASPRRPRPAGRVPPGGTPAAGGSPWPRRREGPGARRGTRESVGRHGPDHAGRRPVTTSG